MIRSWLKMSLCDFCATKGLFIQCRIHERCTKQCKTYELRRIIWNYIKRISKILNKYFRPRSHHVEVAASGDPRAMTLLYIRGVICHLQSIQVPMLTERGHSLGTTEVL
ncbi:hypothetical protein V1478_002340 [Vespula squamosa]|uniref:Uncharacterized protein n=1 Tax=Vespula squamosa TaxID=30214 RepID=A0ABD2BVU2_VESSQ